MDARTMPFSPTAADRPMARSSVRTISVENSFVSSGAHRSPKWRVRGVLAWAVPSKRRYFWKAARIAAATSSPLMVPGQARASDSPFSQGVSTGSLCPSTVFHLADCMAYTSWFFSIHSCRES